MTSNSGDAFQQHSLFPDKRRRWAKELFDEKLASGTLYGSKEELELSRENVYYRSKHASEEVLRLQAAFFGTSSEDKRFPGSSSIRACSRLERVVVDKPKLFRRFSIFSAGVYEWRACIRYCEAERQ